LEFVVIKHSPTETPDRMDREKVLRVAVSMPRHPNPRLVELAQPFAVVGRADEADITLEGDDVSFRHAYLQRLAGRVFCIDLSSKTGTYWGEKRRYSGWLSPRKAVRIGGYSLCVRDDPADGVEPGNGDQTNLPAAQLEGLGHAGRYVLEFFDDSVPEPIREIKHEIALVGRSSKCHIQVDDESVSRVHCALVPTVEGLLVVDLLGRGGTRVDHKRIRWSYAEAGSVLTIGRYELSVWHRTSAATPGSDTHLGEIATFPAVSADAEAAPSHDATSEATAPLKTDQTQHEASPDPVADWLGTLFAIEHQGTTLVVIPQINDGMFRYEKLRTEASSLRRKLALPSLRGLVVDLHALGYVGWEAISTVVAFARDMEASGRPVAFCCPTPQVQQVLTNMGLSRIWRAHPTREAALAAVSSRSPGSKAGD
jgi:pSer/pThr/pTyr-binding forkhead associated (FHA) protein/anti-anti-sigma regulatory factor